LSGAEKRIGREGHENNDSGNFHRTLKIKMKMPVMKFYYKKGRNYFTAEALRRLERKESFRSKFSRRSSPNTAMLLTLFFFISWGSCR
jgi:hypothetical protein